MGEEEGCMITEFHTIEITCDHPNCHALEKVRGDRAAVIENARCNGWLITEKRFPFMTHCPEHAKKAQS